MENYKIIDIQFKNPLNEKEIRLLKEFDEKIPDTNIKLETGVNSLKLFLRAADIHELHNLNNLLSAKYNLDTDQSPLKILIEKIESIKSYGLKGSKRNYVDYNKERKVKDRESKEEKRGLYYYARDNSFNKQNNECPTDYCNKIICGDSEFVLKKLPDNCIDLVFTSPPYNFGLEYDNQDDDNKWERYFEKLFKIFDECVRVLKYGGRIIVNIQPLFSDYIPTHHIISNFFIDKKLIWKGEIIWEKNNYNCKYTAWGSWKSPSSPYLKYTWEFIEVFCKGDLVKKGDKENIDINEDEFKKWVVAKWSISPERKMKEYGHPAMFPEELVIRILKLFSFRNDLILDPFNGVGTTTAIAKEFGRRFIGIDISEEYCKKAEERTNRGLF
ncbi:MAG: site-specific DNA-methyltransferase [Ignavibacteria bacterium]|nr:site-specific DNA-methyltransferase [Ignavibacteria bacterium]